MDILFNLGVSFSDFILVVVVLCLSVFMVTISQVYWVRRIGVSSFIALALVKIMPDKFFNFRPEISLIYFLLLTVLVLVLCHGKLFEAAYWEGDRFDFRMIIFVFSVFLFFVAVTFYLLDYNYFDEFFTENFFGFLRHNLFFFAIIPIIFGMIFKGRE